MRDFFPHFRYIKIMQTKKLNETNPYLKNPVSREKGLWTTVSTSAAIEDIHVTKDKVTSSRKPLESEQPLR